MLEMLDAELFDLLFIKDVNFSYILACIGPMRESRPCHEHKVAFWLRRRHSFNVRSVKFYVMLAFQ